MQKKASSLLYQIVVHLILIALLFGLFFLASLQKINSRDTKKQVLEKEIALLIDSATPGMELTILKENYDSKGGKSLVNNLDLINGKVIAEINGLKLSQGYPYFSPYSVSINKFEDKYVLKIEK